jgi:tungstate transport system permease protein
MGFIADSLTVAIGLLVSFDREIFNAVWVTLWVGCWSILLAAILGVPLGVLVGLHRFPMRGTVVTLLNTLMALPTVVVGLVIYGLISRQGPLGELGLLFSPQSMVIGQTVLAIPIVANYTLSIIEGADPRIVPTSLSLGGTRVQGVLLLLREVRFGIMAALIAGFGRVISEVGVAMMLGGNIKGYTRTMTTAIALETSKGEFGFGLALGLVLMSVALLVNLLLHTFQQR